MPACDPRFADEETRLAVMEDYGADALEDDPELGAIVRFAARLCGTPSATITLVEDLRQRFLAKEGLTDRETSRDVSFCAHAMLQPDLMEVNDPMQDPRFANNPLVTGDKGLRYYAGQPLVSDEGAPLGALCVLDTEPHAEPLDDLQRAGMQVLAQAVMRRLDARRANIRAAREIEEREARLRRMIDGVPTIAWSADAEGNFDYFNSRWREWIGDDPPRVADDWRPFVHPEDAEEAFAAWAEAYSRGEEFEVEYRMKHADGSWRWVLSLAVPVAQGEERGMRWFGTVTDIDDVHQALQQRDMLARELSHRIKNIFAVIIGLASLKVKRTPEHEPFARELTDVMRALGRAHEFVRPESGVVQESLQGLLESLFSPYAHGEQEKRVLVTGVDAEISPAAATPLALVFHELATNSAKYGALSNENGKVMLEITDEGQMIGMRWAEEGGPKITASGVEGFGTRLLEMSVSGQLGGSIERQFHENGMVAAISIAKSAIAR